MQACDEAPALLRDRGNHAADKRKDELYRDAFSRVTENDGLEAGRGDRIGCVG